MSDVSATSWITFVSKLTRKIDRPIAIAFACIVALLLRQRHIMRTMH